MRHRLSSPDVSAVLAEIARRPREVWERLVRARFSDDVLARHALVWLHADVDCQVAGQPDLADATDRFRLELLLDRGATASVWKGYDRKLGRNVALKIFHTDRTPGVEAILSEARAACDIVSDHVVRIYDVHENEPFFIVMELVGEHDPRDGQLVPAQSAAQCRPTDLAEAIRWIRDVARGVHDAHLRNVFHRDLKPHNVLITPFSRRARIADFGLAIRRRASQEANAVPGLTLATSRGSASIEGTPEYMAPEQACGLPLDLDAADEDDRAALIRIDVWGLGAVACFVLTGHPPWCSSAEYDAWEVAAGGGVPKLSDVAFDKTRLPGTLQQIVTRALSVTPEDRYRTASELADELDAYLERRPTSHDRDASTRLVLWARRNPQLCMTLCAALVLGTMLSLAFTSVLRLRDESRLLEVRTHRLADEARTAQRDLDATEKQLSDRNATLSKLRRALSDAQKEYGAILSTKERALRTADLATTELTKQLTTLRSERDGAETARDTFERFLKRARAEADQTAAQLEATTLERDRALTDRARAIKERDVARAARMSAERQRDEAEAAQARELDARRELELELARLNGALKAGSDATQ